MNVLANSTPQAVGGRPTKGRKAKANKRSRKPKRAAAPVAKPIVHLSDCILTYASVLNAPTKAYHEGLTSCVPDDVVFPTIKRAFLLRGTAVVGTTGFGYVLFNPYSPGNVTNYNVQFSTAATGITITDSFTNDANADFEAFPASQVGGNQNFESGIAEYRIVGAELCVDYSGTLLNRGGTYTSYHSPHNDDQQISTPTRIMAEATAYIETIGAKTASTKWLPSSSGDLGFINGAGYFYTNTIVFAAEPGATFMWTATAHYELVGRNFRDTGGVTMSESDTPGLSAVLNAANATAADPVSTPTFIKKVGEALVKTTSYITQGIVTGALAGATVAAQRRLAVRN